MARFQGTLTNEEAQRFLRDVQEDKRSRIEVKMGVSFDDRGNSIISIESKKDAFLHSLWATNKNIGIKLGGWSPKFTKVGE